jgi:aminopeptidase 2
MHFERLPKNVLPINYELTVRPDFNSYKFDGNVIIDLNVSLKEKFI